MLLDFVKSSQRVKYKDTKIQTNIQTYKSTKKVRRKRKRKSIYCNDDYDTVAKIESQEKKRKRK